MSLILPRGATNQVHIVQDPAKFRWKGVPYQERYGECDNDPELMARVHEIDPLLDIKFYYPTQRKHLVRYYKGRDVCEWARVWEFEDKPELGLHKEVGWWIIEALQAGDTQGAARTRADDVEKHNATVDEKHAKDRHELSLDLAKEIRKPLLTFLDQGGQAIYKGVV